MATKVTKVCDVTGTTKGVESYRVTVQKIVDVDGGENETVVNATVDLCSKSFDRLSGFILRGCRQPPPRATKGDDDAASAPEAVAEPPSVPAADSEHPDIDFS